MGRRYSPPSPSQDLEAKLRKVYDDMNRLADQVARVSDDGRRRTDGREGDLRLVRDKTNDGFELEGRFKEGYVRVGKATEQDKRLAALDSRLNNLEITDPRFSTPWQQIGEIGITVLVGMVTGLYVTGINQDILEDSVISVENIIGGEVLTFTLSSNYITATDAGIVDVIAEQIYEPILVGSKVYLNS